MYEKILVPLDGSELAESILPHVETMIRGGGAKEVVFLRVLEPLPASIPGGDYFMDEELVKKLRHEHETAARNYLEKLTGGLGYEGVALKKEVVTGNPAESIIAYAERHQMDLIIMATHGRSGISKGSWEAWPNESCTGRAFPFW